MQFDVPNTKENLEKAFSQVDHVIDMYQQNIQNCHKLKFSLYMEFTKIQPGFWLDKLTKKEQHQEFLKFLQLYKIAFGKTYPRVGREMSYYTRIWVDRQRLLWKNWKYRI